MEILVATLVDGRPDNNFLHKDVTFNPDGLLNNATHLVAAGGRLYITSPQGLSVVDVRDPMHPKLAGHYGGEFLRNPRAVAIQFQYAFVTDDEGLKIFSLTDPDHPAPIPGARVPLADAHKLYLARTYCYVADGKDGLAIIDIERPDHPHVAEMYDRRGSAGRRAGREDRLGQPVDVRPGRRRQERLPRRPDDLARERARERRVQPEARTPILIATYPVEGATAIGRGLDRDRVVDETGAQTVVFGRRGSRPFNLNEMLPFLRHGDVDGDGKDGHRAGLWYRVEDVAVEKDKAGKQTLLTKSGGSLSVPVAFVDPTGTPAPVVMLCTPGTPGAMYPNGAPVPPGGYAPLPEQEPGHEFMNAPDVQRLLRTMDPTRPPDQPPGTVPIPTPAVSPTPAAGSANPFLQGDAADRLSHLKQQPSATPANAAAPDAAAPTPTTPPPLTAPGTPSDNSFLQQGDADRLLRSRQTPVASPTPSGPPH